MSQARAPLILCLASLAAAACASPQPDAPPARPAAAAPAASKVEAAPKAGRRLPLDTIRLPEGFRIELYADDVPGARSLARSPEGTLYVGTREDRVYALRDADSDHRAEKVHVVGSGLNSPNGVAVRDGALYVAEISRVIRFDGIESRLDDPPAPIVVTAALPKDEHHGWKFIAFGPDGMLYVPIGAPCNVCDPGDPYASITRMKPDGSGFEIVARGVRNTVGFDWHPEDRVLWFTDNGRDWMGDDGPPDELNRAPIPGLHFGYPYCHGRGVADPEFGSRRPCSQTVPPLVELGPHVAALGMRFYTGAAFPQRYREAAFIAEHGSWNRSEPIGYRISVVDVSLGQDAKPEVFAEGWLRGGEPWGRPVDVLVMPDGALLVSDDHAGAIYRISYQAPAP